MESDSKQLFYRINESFVHSYECDDNSMENKKKLNSDPIFKVLKLNNCKSFDNTIRTMKIFSTSTHLFIIILNTTEDWSNINESRLENLGTCFTDARPLIVQLNHVHGIDVFYKAQPTSNFKKLANLYPISEEDFLRRLNSKDGMNLRSLLEGIKSNICGAFDVNILHCEIKKDDLLNQILSVAAKTDVLCFRFLQLFYTYSEESSNDWNLLIDALHFDGFDNIFTILDLPFKVNIDELKLTVEKRSILKGVDDRGFNILMLSIERNNVRALEFFLKFDFDLDLMAKNGKTAADLAWDLKHYECLVKLLEFDSLYPEEFDVEILDAANKIKLNTIVRKIEAFHVAIKTASINIVKYFVSANPHLIFAYNSSNKSAVLIALEAKQFEVYAWLRSFGFNSDCEEKLEDVLKSLKPEEKCKLRETNREFFKTSDSSHLFYLLSRTKLGFNVVNKANCFEVIRKMYTELDEIPEVQAIMLAVENSDKFEIVFDFNKSHVVDLDPLAMRHTGGLTYSKKGVIYVAAGDYESNFKNDCKPYEALAVENSDKFTEYIVKIFKYYSRNQTSVDSIVSNVFECYSKADWRPEMIVRIPQLCARYKNEPDKLNEILNSYCSELFAFYNDKVVKEVINQRILIKPRKDIQEINTLIGLLTTIWSSGIRLTRAKIKKTELFLVKPTSLPINISSDSPQLSLCLMFQSLFDPQRTKVSFLQIFSGTQALANEDFASKIENAFNSKVKPRLIVDCGNDFKEDAKFWSGFFKRFENHGRIVLATSKVENQKLQMIKELPKFQSIELNYSWSDLEEFSQSKLLVMKVSFQSHSIELGQLVSLKSSVCEYLPLNDLLTNQLKVNEIKKKVDIFSNKFYIDRKFIVRKFVKPKKNSEKDLDGFLGQPTQFEWDKDDDDDKVILVHLDLDELIQNAETDKFMIISDKAGTGKSAVLHQIFEKLKEAHPTFWISLVDLKQRIDAFKRILKSKKELKNFPFLFSREPLKLEIAFEIELFLKLFQEGRVIVLFDWFDEISPLFNELVLSLIASFDSSLGNRLWITTRSYLGANLEKSVNTLSCSILPLTELDQEKFLVEYWKSKNITENVEQFARKLIHKQAEVNTNDRSDLIGSPLLVRMLAEMFEDDISSVDSCEALNFYSIFETFLSKIIRTWMKKGELSDLDQEEIHKQKLIVIDVHQKIAISYFFESLSDKCQYNKTKWSNEKIARIGIINFDDESGEAQFVHVTFAEYFAVNLIVSDLKEGDAIFGSSLFTSFIVSPGYEVIRIFLNKALEDIQLEDNVLKSYGATFIACLEQKNSYNILHKPLQEGRTSLVNFILTLFKAEKWNFLLKKVLMEKNEKSESILMSACLSKDFPLLEKVWFLLYEYLTTKELADLVNSTEVSRIVASRYIAK